MSGVPTTAESARVPPTVLPQDRTVAEQQVLAADASFGATNEDIATRERLVAPEFVNISFEGRFRTRAQQVETWRTSRHPPLARDADRHLRIYGSVAIVTARLVAPDRADSGFFTRVWLQRRDGWQLVLAQDAGNRPDATADVAEDMSPLQGEEQAVFRAYRTLRDKFFHGDVEAVRQGTTDDFELITPAGDRLLKAQVLTTLRKRPLPKAEDEVRVMIFGEAALITLRRRPADAPLMRNSFVWVRAGGGWLEASTQQTVIANQ